MRKVSDMLKRKNRNIVSVSSNTTVIDALKMMSTQNIGSVMVVEDGKFLGIMTERDYSRKVVLNGKLSSETPVGEIMSTQFPTVTSADSVETCMQYMSEKHIRYLPVIENGSIKGIVSINDIVTEIIAMQEETISHLQNYIQS